MAFPILRAVLGLAGVVLALATSALAQPRHAIAMYGDPALPPDFVALPYADPDAPKGGRIVFGAVGGFDALNPHILKGRAPWGVRAHVFESLMARNWDEPFSLYGLLAESVETGPNREWVEFVLRSEATFSDGAPVTVEDVIWSFETLGTRGHPRFRAAHEKIAQIVQTGPQSLRVDFNAPDRELPLIMGLRPIFQKAQFDGRAFDDSSMIPPIATGPYVIAEADPGRQLVLRRNPDYWGADLAVNRGRHNFDEIVYEYFTDAGAMFEAFKAGLITSFRETDPARWAEGYDFAAVEAGEIVLSEIPHARPAGVYGLIFNSRRPPFDDWRVREALIHAFNYDFIAQTQTGGADPRIASFFGNSELGMQPGAADGAVRELLLRHSAALLPGALQGYSLPEGDGTARNRRNLRAATELLDEAGWTVSNGRLRDGSGESLRFDILIAQGSAQQQAIANIYVEALERLGIAARAVTIDDAQYRARTDTFDFDVTFYRRALSLSPGNEQTLYWGSVAADQEGSRNWAGIASPAIDATIEALVRTETHGEFVAAARALDRLLMSGRYVIPLWFSQISRIAHSAELHYPEALPVYGDWIGFQPDVWWWQQAAP